MGVVATYSFANGLIYWFIGFLMLFFISHADKKTKKLKIIIWAIVSLMIIWMYSYGYHKPGDHPSLLFIFKNPIEFIKFLLACIGAPVYRYRRDVATFFGLSGMIISVYLVWVLIKSRKIKFDCLVPYIALSVYSLGSAFITAFGRAGFGGNQALRSRYITISNLFWISNIAFFYLLAIVKEGEFKNKIANIRTAKFNPDRLYHLCFKYTASKVKRWSVAAIIVALLILNAVLSTEDVRTYRKILTRARDELKWSGKNDQLLKYLYSKTDMVKARRVVLQKYKLSAFRN